MSDFFISYVEKDSRIAAAITEGLELAGYSTWYYMRDARPKISFFEQAAEALEQSRASIVILSPNSIGSLTLSVEILKAHEKAKRIIPILIGFSWDAVIRAKPEWPLYMRATDAIVTTPDTIPRTAALLIRHLKNLEIGPGGIPDQPKEKLESPSSPKAYRNTALRPDGILSEEYDVFISYRRDKASQTARLIRAELQNLGYKVFLDVDDLRHGHFDEALLQRIRETPNFVLILFEGSLDRCADPEDWLRQEIVCALEAKQKIVPIMMPGFVFPAPDVLPPEIRPIRIHNAIPYSHDFFKAMLEKLAGFLGPPRSG